VSRRLLVLSVSAGAGHVRAAQALVAWARAQGREAAHIDVMDHVPRSFRKLYAEHYVDLVTRYPLAWAKLYQITDRARPSAPLSRLRRLVERLNTRPLRRAVAEFAPDAIVCTHFLPAELLLHERLRGRLDVPVFVQVTDFDLHALWVVPQLDGYFAASDEVAQRMRARGLPAARIHVTGIPLMPAFAAPPDRAAAAAAMGLDPTRFTVLLMGGGAGLGGLETVAERVLGLDPSLQLAALAGRNADTLAALQALAARHGERLRPFGFTDRVAELMAASDVAVTKPGGLTTSECLALGLPMIVHAPIPGQEERNCDYLLEQGAGLKAVDAVALEYRLAALLAAPARTAALRERARALGRPQAAAAVLAVVDGAATAQA
jgi:processive 1,2-diacylglycerol beta-glucosyltransferase